MSKQIIWGCCEEDSDSTKDDCVKCQSCNTFHHILCLQPTNTKEAALIKSNSNWKCPMCSISSRCCKEDDTPIQPHTNKNITKRSKKRVALSSPPHSIESALTTNDIREIIREELKKVMQESLSELNKNMCALLNSELKDLKNELQSIKDSMTFMNSQYEDVMRDFKSISATVEEVKLQNHKLHTTVHDLSHQIHILEQNARASNIEIQCIPESRNENIVNIVKQLGNAIGINIKEENISHCTRIAKKNRESTRPRSIIVQLNSPLSRDNILAAVTKFNRGKDKPNKLNTSHLGYKGESKPVYVNEHLSAYNKELHAATRIKAREKGYLYTWIRNGRIFVRKNANSEYRLIKDYESLKNLI